jgi:hypothetical protein
MRRLFTPWTALPRDVDGDFTRRAVYDGFKDVAIVTLGEVARVFTVHPLATVIAQATVATPRVFCYKNSIIKDNQGRYVEVGGSRS